MPYYIGDRRLITLMMKLDCDVAVATLDDLENFYLKRSYVRKDVEYVYLFHHMTSVHLVSSREALDHYDAVLCVGPHQKRELERMAELRDIRPRTLVECGYDLLDRQIAGYARREKPEHARPVVLLAPSWQEDCILDICADDVIEPLLGRGYRVIVRPHPEYTKRYRARWESLQERYAAYSDDELHFEQDFSSSDSIYDADVLITDWSSISCEFAFATLKPCVFVDTPMKTCNPRWQELGIEPTDISLRNSIGRSVSMDALAGLGDTVDEMVAHPEAWRDAIADVRSTILQRGPRRRKSPEFILLERVLEKQALREEGGRNGR